MLISGSACGGNSTSTTGPAMETTRPFSSGRAARIRPAGFGRHRLYSSLELVVRTSGTAPGTGPPQRLRTPDDLHDLGRDRILADAVHQPAERRRELVGILGRGGHRPLPGGVLRGRRLEQRLEEHGLGVARHERREQVLGRRLEIVEALWRRRGLRPGPPPGPVRRARAAGAGAPRPPGCRRNGSVWRRAGRGRPRRRGTAPRSRAATRRASS